MSISLLEMGKTKKRNAREAIISILSRKFPLSIKKIYNEVKKEYHLDITYQAVFKLIKEMSEDSILEKLDKEYKLNINWIKQLEDELDIIKHSYLKSEDSNEDYYKEDANKFIIELAPKIIDYIGKDEICIVGISGVGNHYANALWKYLLKEGKKVNFVELNKSSLLKEKTIRLDKKDFENKKVIIIDKAIFSGNIYRLSTNKINSLKNRLKIKGIKYAVNYDSLDLADFSVSK